MKELRAHRARSRLGHAIVRLGVSAAISLSSFDLAAQVVATPEEIQAVYLQKFVGYVDWPPGVFPTATAPIVVGISGSDRMFDLVSGVAAGKTVQARPIMVRRLVKPEDSDDVHLVFVGKESWKDLPGWTARSKEHPMVVATDAPQGVDRGATLGFVQTGQRIRFEASVAAAEKAGVKLSARLLAVADRVVGAGQ